MAILFPVATKAAYQADPGNETIMISVIASILAGSVFGDHISPISDTTILSAIATRCAASPACCNDLQLATDVPSTGSSKVTKECSTRESLAGNMIICIRDR